MSVFTGAVHPPPSGHKQSHRRGGPTMALLDSFGNFNDTLRSYSHSIHRTLMFPGGWEIPAAPSRAGAKCAEWSSPYPRRSLLMCDKEAIEVQKILPFLSDTWPLCRIGRAVIRASQSCRQSCNKSQCPACGCRSHHSCTHAPQFSRSFPAREWGSVLQRQGACGQCP